MRVGIVTEYYRPWPGGISEHVHHQAVELTERGHDVTVFTGPSVPGWTDDGPFEVERLPWAHEFTHNGARSRMVLSGALLGFRKRFRRHALDVVHVHAPMDPFLGWAALLASESATVGTFHANFDPSGLWDGLFRRLRMITGRAFDRMHGRIAVSEAARESIAHYFPGEFEIIPNGVDTERFRPDVEPVLARDEDRPTILFVGRADPRKGLPILIQAFERLRKSMPAARLIVVGVEKDEVASELAGVAPETSASIEFAGYADPGDMAGYYTSCDVFCSPATGQESQGIVLLEAMAAGRPPVAFAIPGYRDVVQHGVDGWLIDPIGAEELASGLGTILGDRVALSRMAETGRKTALGFSWPRVVERIEHHYARALDEMGRSE